MLLHCTLVRGPCAALQMPPVELTIEGPPGVSGADLQAELASRFGTAGVSVKDRDVSVLTLGHRPLVNGAVLVDGASKGSQATESRSWPPASLALAVHSGAGAGLVVPLRRGTYTIGRSHGEVRIADADMSRAHARLVVTETSISIVDLDSANGTEVDGERVRTAVISTGSTIRCGNSTMSVVFLGPPGTRLDNAGTAVNEPLLVARRDDHAVNRATLLLTAVLPLLIGVGLALITGLWMFLAFTAVSAISILVPLFAGRRQARELEAALRTAVRTDQERRRRAAPPLSDLTLAAATVGSKGTPAANEGIWLRLGQAVQPANLRYEPSDPGKAVPSAGLLPLTLNPSRQLTTIRGPRDSVEALMRGLLMQLAGYPSARGMTVVVHGKAQRLPIAARYLRDFALTSDIGFLETILHRSIEGRGVLVVLDEQESAARLVGTALDRGWQIIHLLGGPASPAPADVELGERASFFHSGGESLRFSPDLVPLDVFNRYCRRLAWQSTDSGPSDQALPLSCSLADLLPHSAADISRRWSENRDRPGLVVPLGRSLGGIRWLDLHTDGPHLLVAGTTGSGKSELLRSLTVNLAASYPPDRINFLFVDFKGGSGLGPLTGLPHCVGMLTDLASHELERSLHSLRAEIKFREETLAAVQAPDLASYRSTSEGRLSPLPHLVIVIDEFRMLVEDAPEALGELMRIAAIGRSLGIHLIMATQRPQGALTADIRANVTTSIALRVQSEMESLDIINSKAAAGISVDTPGRAFLARGAEAALEFQSGSLNAGAATSAPPGISVRPAVEYTQAPAMTRNAEATGASTAPAAATAPLVASMSRLWESTGAEAIRKPVAAPLPCVLPEPDWSDAQAGERWSITLGMMDLPAEQRTAPLAWEPALHGHLGLVGGPESGAFEALRLAVLRLASHERESHLYVLDPDGSFADLASHDRVGARAGLHELRRAVRILERLADVQSWRLARPGEDTTPLVLVIAGWGSWLSAFRSGPTARAEDLVHDLVRDGTRAGITVVISGQRDLVTSRFFEAVPNRVYFPTGSNEDSRIAWPKLPPTPMAAGRGVATGALAAGKTAVCQFYTSIRPEAHRSRAGYPEGQLLPCRPFRVEPLPAVAAAAQIAGPATATADQGHRCFRIGVGGDELEPVSVRVPAGGVLAALGGPSSGKSSFLRLLPQLNPSAGPWLRREPASGPASFWTSTLRRAEAGELAPFPVALVDDADLLPPEAKCILTDLNALGLTVVLTAGFSPLLSQRLPLVHQARSLGTGVLIAPRSMMDGDFFGVRFEPEPNPPPGRSVLVQHGLALPVQLGWVPPPDNVQDGLPTGSVDAGGHS